MEQVKVGDVFTMVDENEEVQELEVVGTLSIDDAQYVAVGFADEVNADTTDDMDIFFLKVDSNEELVMIEEDEEYEAVVAAFEETDDEE
ncbi:DUF1292 domain-containing protein [Paenisporosarcina cavernae]|uniref:DUF1292 domain-containing protein n=1 Tax=Paenisporosarcina cavernae TaxID=2320858 RepID=A0A385YV33_9BACL|nr:DUF1292 domain-containing protein [Paenisporosarcina cavernae]AYC30331.1 DUF1292 domain-containing protein [Paenisporosarcina cavernae]